MSSPGPFNFDFPVVLTASGLQPTAPATINSQIDAAAQAAEPGLTTNLPGSLIEDVLSTDTAAVSLIDQYRVELINSLTPFGANEFVLQQLAQVYGLTLGTPTNTSVYVVFTGTIGYVITNGFLVGDGTNVYAVQGGGVIGSGGSSPPLQAIALASGSFAVPQNTVTQLVTSVPASITLAVNNPLPGSPGTVAETYYSFRQRVLQAGLAASVGTSRYIKTLVGNLVGAQGNLVSVQVSAGGQLRIVVGGSADEYQIANAIFQSIDNPGTLVGSAINVNRNVTVSLTDYPDTYAVVYVEAPAQTITMAVTWNTTLPNFTGGAAFPGLVQQPIADYINGLGIGQVINVLELNEIFQIAVEDVLDGQYLTRLVFAVSINGVLTNPGAGTFAITGDPESYFTCAPSGILVAQG